VLLLLPLEAAVRKMQLGNLGLVAHDVARPGTMSWAVFVERLLAAAAVVVVVAPTTNMGPMVVGEYGLGTAKGECRLRSAVFALVLVEVELEYTLAT